ncbi:MULTISPECIES: hypothetical protein [unclassified Xanthomonas]|uniref:hypothetical protein n=1 Tax=Xanthomonas sp. LMG 8992 TaxID=1591157 RepID=UPI00136FE56F|nr:hypothetical protein [Xanthomonas sp. LMG 8992]
MNATSDVISMRVANGEHAFHRLKWAAARRPPPNDIDQSSLLPSRNAKMRLSMANISTIDVAMSFDKR